MGINLQHRKCVLSEALDDFHTRLLDEHWGARHEETREQIQARIDELLKRKAA